MRYAVLALVLAACSPSPIVSRDAGYVVSDGGAYVQCDCVFIGDVCAHDSTHPCEFETGVLGAHCEPHCTAGGLDRYSVALDSFDHFYCAGCTGAGCESVSCWTYAGRPDDAGP